MAYGVELWGWEERKEIRKNNVRLCQMDVQTGFLYTTICDIKGVRNRKVKGQMRDKSVKIRREDKRERGKQLDKNMLEGKKKYGRERSI